jgi:division protein CdvB (Snf7/Vps24/ESCRT-III family)
MAETTNRTVTTELLTRLLDTSRERMHRSTDDETALLEEAAEIIEAVLEDDTAVPALVVDWFAEADLDFWHFAEMVGAA